MRLILGSANFSKGYGIDKKKFFKTSNIKYLVEFCKENKIAVTNTPKVLTKCTSGKLTRDIGKFGSSNF